MARRAAKRDNAYYETLLRRRDPTVYSEFEAGKYPSLRRALIAAGIRQEVGLSENLMRHWKRATPKEQADFLAKIGPVGGAAVGLSSSATSLVDSDGYLLPEVADTVKCIIAVRNLKMGPFANELGFRTNDYRISASLKRGQAVPTDVVVALENWVAMQSICFPGRRRAERHYGQRPKQSPDALHRRREGDAMSTSPASTTPTASCDCEQRRS